MNADIQTIQDGDIASVPGVSASGVACGLKTSGLDLGIIHSRVPANAAAVFTQNQIKGAHVPHCATKIEAGRAQTIVVNSRNANACNGPLGPEHADAMANAAADALTVDSSLVYPCSTGTIGIVLPIEKVCDGIVAAAAALRNGGGADFSCAIMTTDTRPKSCAITVQIDGKAITVGGVAKGAGMIEPNMATMLAYVATDADVASQDLQILLSGVVSESFNAISVDGDQSCNDTVMLLANGESGLALTRDAQSDSSWAIFAIAVKQVCVTLAKMIVQDGEGATKLATIHVVDAACTADARLAARAVANSLLVKTSWFGEDPNWGRVIDVVGYSGAELDASVIEIWYDNVCAYRGTSGPVPDSVPALEAVIKQPEFTVKISLGTGNEECSLLTCDISEEYVRINSEYTT